ncbi:MAG: GH39 family glycosyl hydrolase [Candidatus Zhuqueibacterota bacterium]
MDITEIRIDSGEIIGPFRPIWRSFGYDEINWTYTPRGKRLFDEISRLSPEPYFIRCHNAFTSGNGLSTPSAGSCNVYSVTEQGEVIYDFSLLDQVVETILSHHAKPIVELGFMPDTLSSGPAPKPTYNYDRSKLWTYPPRNYAAWQQLVFSTVRHFVEKYGAKEIETWYWEVWNEPDFSGFFRGTVKDYCRLYDHSVAGAVAALPTIRIGGPALAASSAFLEKFLAHCARGKNAASRQRGTRLDFISFHAKGNGWPITGVPFEMPSLAAILAAVKKYRQVIAKFPQYQATECLFDECDMAVATNYGMYDFPELEFNNTAYYPAFLVRMVKYLSDFIERENLPISCFTTWAFYFEGKRFFEGNRSLVTNENIKLPVFNAFPLLEKLGRTRIQLDAAGFPITDGLATKSAPDRIEVALWNFDETQANSSPAGILLRVVRLPQHLKRAAIRRYQIDAQHSNAYSAWKEMGSPQYPTDSELAALRSRQNLELIEEVHSVEVRQGNLEYSLTLPACSVCVVQIECQ